MTTPMSIFSGLLFYLVTTMPTHAQMTVDVSQITCKEFLLDTVTMPDNIAYWLNGYYNGQRSNTTLHLIGVRDYVSKLTDYCVQNQDMTVMKGAEIVLGVSK